MCDVCEFMCDNCMCEFVYGMVCVYVCDGVWYIYVYLFVCMWCMCIGVHICMCACAYMHECVCICMCVHVYVSVCAFTHVCTGMHVRAYQTHFLLDLGFSHCLILLGRKGWE